MAIRTDGSARRSAERCLKQRGDNEWAGVTTRVEAVLTESMIGSNLDGRDEEMVS